MFRSTHGTAPRHYDKFEVNHIASILSTQLMMEWLTSKHNDKSTKEAAERIDKAVDITLTEGKVRTYDTGGSSSQLAMSIHLNI